MSDAATLLCDIIEGTVEFSDRLSLSENFFAVELALGAPHRGAATQNTVRYSRN